MPHTQKDLYNKNIGKKGERRAIKFLKRKKYKILERNYKCPAGEADVIAMDKGALVFVEVKTRTNDSYGLPSESVTDKKMEHYRKIAYFYCGNVENFFIRFDVIEVCGKDITHIENAFY